LISAGSQRAHDYYWMPLLVVTSLLMGVAAQSLLRGGLKVPGFLSPVATRSIAVVGLCFIIAVASRSVSAQIYSIPPYQEPHIVFTERLREVTAPGELLIVGHYYSRGPGPATSACCRRREADGRYLAQGSVELYQSGRRGWVLNLEDWNLETVEYLSEKGARYFVTGYGGKLRGKAQFVEAMDQHHRLVERNEDWAIWEILPAENSAAP